MKIYVVTGASVTGSAITVRRPLAFKTAAEAEAEIERLTEEAEADAEVDWIDAIDAGDAKLTVCHKSDVLEAYRVSEVEVAE